MTGIAVITAAAVTVGRPNVWSSSWLGIALWLPGLMAALEGGRGRRSGLLWSVAGTAVIAAGAVLDHGTRPVVSRWELLLALSAVAVTAAAWLVRGDAVAGNAL